MNDNDFEICIAGLDCHAGYATGCRPSELIL